MDLPEIKALIDAMAASDLAEMEVAKNGWTLRLVRRADRAEPIRDAPRPAPPAVVGTDSKTPPTLPDGLVVRAPLAGTVYLSSSPGEPAVVEAGQAVLAGATLCVIEAMKVFIPVTAERDGIVEAVLVASGDAVEAGQPLLRIA
jgi:acetyl-CoA carboxylase biotin carboxyl carrier protein